MRLDMKSPKTIVDWLSESKNKSDTNGFVVGVSGGIDSALTSTLCAMTGNKTIVVSMPICQENEQNKRSHMHMDWLCEKFPNVEQRTIDLSSAYMTYKNLNIGSDLSLANTRSRLRMVTLYLISNTENMLVVGTGNKIEDYGIGFFTKYGDGGVDISPIAELLKSEVKKMSKKLGIIKQILEATPTDGLWDDARSDEDQIGASYDELEWALNYYDKFGYNTDNLTERQREVLLIYFDRHTKNRHKLELPRICKFGEK